MVVGEPKRSIMEGIENTGDVRLHDHRLRLKQKFDIIRKLGQGTYGKVQLGINKKTGQEVAIKTIKKCKIETEADLVRIRREVQIMSSVRHPNIVHIYEVFENSEKMILVMEYCSGGELYDHLSQKKVLQEDEARRLFRQIATAVYYCHKHKICHRDLKLENVLLDENENAKIADFGLSNVFEERRLLSTFCGSPLYASPEIVKGTPYIGPEVDCWSLGVLLYTLVYGAMPFDGSNFKRLVKQISTGDYFEPKSPSSASPLIRDMLTVDPIQRADITHICDNPWVNKLSDVSCLELAESLANETPVRLDLLLSLAPPPIHGSDKLVVTDEAAAVGADGSPARSMSVANIDNSAERRILEMVAEGGTDAIKPSPTRTIVSAEQPKRKLETTVSMDNAPSQRKKERSVRSSSKTRVVPAPQSDTEVIEKPTPDKKVEPTPIPREMSVDNNQAIANSNNELKKTTSKQLIESNNKQDIPAPVAHLNSLSSNVQPADDTVTNKAPSSSPVKTVPATENLKKEFKIDPKKKDAVLKEKPAPAKTGVVLKKKVNSITTKTDEKNKVSVKEKSPPRKSIEKDAQSQIKVEKKISSPEDSGAVNQVSPIKFPTERRRSRILDAAEKLNNLSIQPTQPTGDSALNPPLAKPKKVIIPGVSVGSFKEQFERRASLTSGNVPPLPIERKLSLKTTPGNVSTPSKPLLDKKAHSVDSELAPIEINHKEPVRLQTIGVEPSPQPKEEITKVIIDIKKPQVPEAPNRITKPLLKSESLKEPSSKRESLHNSLSLEDARRNLQQSMALLTQAKNDYKPESNSEDITSTMNDRQKQLKTARDIISNALGEETNGKKAQRIGMGAKPPVPYGSSGRSASGSISLGGLGSLPSSPPISPPHQPLRPLPRESPARTFRTEVQHRVDDVRNKYLPSSRGGSVERIIPIHMSEEAPKSQHSQSGPMAYQRNNSMPYRLSSVPRSSSIENDAERHSQATAAPTTRTEPIKKSPREFIIPISVEGLGYVTPRQGSLEPSETPTKLTSSSIGFASRFPKPKRLSSLVSGGESEDEDDMHMHRLRSSRRSRAEPEKESVSSGEEDDDEGFELLTADNLFSTLLDRVRSLTNRLNGEEGTGFPQHHQSLFNNLHSPFFNSPHLPRKHKRHNITREGPSWRRSTSRDIASDFDSMFPSRSSFPRGSKKSSRTAASNKNTQQYESSRVNLNTGSKNEATSLNNEKNGSPESLDLSDLDLSKIELSDKEMETLSGLTPALSKRLQKQLLAHLPPAAARSLRRTLSVTGPRLDRSLPHKYTRSSSASKTLPEAPRDIQDDEATNSCSSTRSRSDREPKTSASNCNSRDCSDSYSLRNDKSSNSFEFENDKVDQSIATESDTPKREYGYRSTPDRSVLSKYFSPERVTSDFALASSIRNDPNLNSILSETNNGTIGNSIDSSFGAVYSGGSSSHRSLKSPPVETSRRRVSRFLRPDFFDTPREESVYFKDKKDKELETQQVLKEIRQKKNRGYDSGPLSPSSPMTSADMSSLFESTGAFVHRSCLSPASPHLLTPRERSRSVTPFYPILDNIKENHDSQVSAELQEALMKIDKKLDASNFILSCPKSNLSENSQAYLDGINNNEEFVESNDINGSPCLTATVQLNSLKGARAEEPLRKTSQNGKESKILRPKSYPTTSPEKINNIPINETRIISTLDNQIDKENTETLILKPAKSQSVSDDNGNIAVSFNINLPVRNPKCQKTEEKVTEDSTTKKLEQTEEKKNKLTSKKKVVVKKKTVKKADSSNASPEKSTAVNQNNEVFEETDLSNSKVKEPAKKKSVLQSIGQKFEKFRTESFHKANSQDNESLLDEAKRPVSVGKDETKVSRIENVMRALRERSVPAANQPDTTTESGLIKRAVTVTNLPTLDSKDSTSRRSVNRVLGLFKKVDSKDNTEVKKETPKLEKIDSLDNNNTETGTASTVHSEVQISESKPKRPTSLLLNGIGKRVQACYSGATSENIEKKNTTSEDSTGANATLDENKNNEAKTNKKGLRLDFSRLPKLNPNIFNKRNSLELAKSKENDDESDTKNQVSYENAALDNIPTPTEDQSLSNTINKNIQDLSNGSVCSPNWSPDCDTSKFMVEPQTTSKSTEVSHPHRNHEATSPDPENIVDRIRRKSFYSRFNEKKNRRKSLLVGPGAKEYNPSERIHSPADADPIHYSNKYDLSPVSPSKYMLTSPLSFEHNRTLLSEKDSSRLKNSNGNESHSSINHRSLDRNENRYSIDSKYDANLDNSSHYSIPRYNRTVSLFDNAYDSRQNGLELRGSNSRYGRTFSSLSPGNYATYSPRTHSRNSAILLRTSADTEINAEDVLTKIRNRKKMSDTSISSIDKDTIYLENNQRSNHTPNGEHDTPAEQTD